MYFLKDNINEFLKLPRFPVNNFIITLQILSQAMPNSYGYPLYNFSADRAKQIKCKAVVNEDPTEKLIRELQEENEKLKAALSGGGTAVVLQDTEGMSAAGRKLKIGMDVNN